MIRLSAFALACAAALPASASAQLPPIPNPLPPPGSSDESPDPKAPPGPSPGDEATGYQGGSAHQGLARTDALFPPVAQRWTRRLDGSPSYPLIAGGRVIVLDTKYGERSTLRAFRLGNGRRLWATPVEATTPGELALEGGRVFVVNEAGPNASRISAYDAATGEQVWSHALDGGQAGGVPGVENGVIAVATTRALFGLDAAAGGELWKVFGWGGRFAIRDGGVIRLNDCGKIAANDLADGRALWERDVGEGGTCSQAIPSIADGRFYAPGADEVLDARTGATVAPAPPDSAVVPVIAGDTAVFAEDPRLLVARPIEGGAPRWRRRNGDGFGGDPPALATPFNVWAASFDGSVYAFDLDTGALRERLPHEIDTSSGSATRGLAAAQGTLVVPAFGRLRAYTNLLRPPPRGIDMVQSAPFLTVGQRIYSAAAVGRDLREARPRVRLLVDRFPYGRWRTGSQTRAWPEGVANFELRATRNTRLRIVADTRRSVRSRVFRAYVYPRLRTRFRQDRRRRKVRGFFTVVGPQDMRAGGLLFAMYVQRRGRGRLYRFARTRLRDRRPGRAKGSALLQLRRVGSRDQFYFCVRGIERRGFGKLDRLGRTCGARRTRL
jgi:outer membrane protein assembly factor BamB